MDYQSEAEYISKNQKIKSVKERSEVGTISAINIAKERVGIRHRLGELADTHPTIKSINKFLKKEMSLDYKETPQLYLVEESSKMLVIKTINQAKERVGIRQDLEELADTATYAWKGNRLNLRSIEKPIPTTAANFIAHTIEDYWKLTTVFKYSLDYKGQTTDAVRHNYYFEAIFSQPTAAFPIPQATASVFFRIEDEQIETEKTPKMLFRVEGNFTDHDVRYVAPTADWLLALIQKKIKFFKRIETIKLF